MLSVAVGVVVAVLALNLAPAWMTGARVAPERVVAATLLESNVGATLLNYQGRIANPATGQPLADGTYGVNFFIFDAATAGNQLWTEARSVLQARGLFVILLGEVTPLPLEIFDGRDLWLQAQVNGETLDSRQRIAWVAYAINARKADTALIANTVADNAIDSAKIADGSVGAADLADGSGSGIDADLLDGQTSASFAAAGHTHSSLPIAYGNVKGTGEKYAGTTNFSSLWNAGSSRYEITITGVSYSYSSFATAVTMLDESGCATLNPATNSVSGKLLIKIYNTAGNPVQCSFQFVVFRP